METAAEITPREKLAAAIAELGLTVESVFVPYSRSRNKAEDWQSLNWRCTIKRNGREILTTDYAAGIGHCPSAKKSAPRNFRYPESRFKAMAAAYEIEHGREAKSSFGSDFRPGDAILPDPVDVIHSLSMDSSVLDEGGFEDWAGSLGYDPDSRKAESIYRACLEIALKMRGAIGEAGLEKLREAGEDF